MLMASNSASLNSSEGSGGNWACEAVEEEAEIEASGGIGSIEDDEDESESVASAPVKVEPLLEDEL